jgi:spoIIIJ-associated protein
MKEFFGIFGRKKEAVAAESVDLQNDGQGTPAFVDIQPTGEISAQAQEGAEVLKNIVAKMGFDATIRAEEKEEALFYELVGEDMGRLIGKEGNTLNALQQLLGSIMSKRKDGRVFVKVDANKYRERREQTLRRMARDAAQMAQHQQKPVELEPMTPAERRFIHDELSTWKDVHTYSTGERRDRRIIVAPGAAPAVDPSEKPEEALQEQQA